MKNKDNVRRSQDILFQMLRDIGGPVFGPVMVESFKSEVLPRIKPGPGWDKPLSEQEYEQTLAKIREELPLFLAYLGDAKLPEPPADWTPSQN